MNRPTRKSRSLLHVVAVSKWLSSSACGLDSEAVEPATPAGLPGSCAGGAGRLGGPPAAPPTCERSRSVHTRLRSLNANKLPEKKSAFCFFAAAKWRRARVSVMNDCLLLSVSPCGSQTSARVLTAEQKAACSIKSGGKKKKKRRLWWSLADRHWLLCFCFQVDLSTAPHRPMEVSSSIVWQVCHDIPLQLLVERASCRLTAGKLCVIPAK